MASTVESSNRLKTFAKFFKSYMGVMPIITAAVAPLLTAMKVAPVYESQRTSLAMYSGVLGFLLVAYVFYSRDLLAKLMFSRLVSRRVFASLVTLLIIGGSVACYFTYNSTLDTSISETRERQVKNGQVEWKRQAVLDDYGRDNEILHGPTLALLYLGIFLFAELAFVMMALREYAQDVAKISEAELMFSGTVVIRKE